MVDDKENEDVSSGNWNIAGSYTREKILKHLVLMDDYMKLSIFGYSEINSDVFVGDDNLKNTARLYALKRLIHTIIDLIRNTRFALKGEKHKEDFDKFRERMYKIEKNLHRLRQEKKRGRQLVELSIDETLFGKMIDDISKMIDDINFRLNSAGLIFTPKEEMSMEEIKKGFKDRYISRK